MGDRGLRWEAANTPMGIDGHGRIAQENDRKISTVNAPIRDAPKVP